MMGNRDIGLRVASAVVLAPGAMLAAWAGGFWFLALMVAICALLAWEWAKMSAPRAPIRIAVTVGVVLACTILTAHVDQMSAAFVFLVFGAAIAGVLARRLGQQGLDAAYGVLYLGWPAILIIWLRGMDDGLGWTILLFAVAWSADVMAYVCGSLIGGPKLWPRFSPNKTWAGFVGGLCAGVAAGGRLAMFSKTAAIAPAWGALVGLAAALATMAGDLWESALKRRFGVKDAGDIIPGHGGLLDRVDGLMFAIVVAAAARLIVPAVTM